MTSDTSWDLRDAKVGDLLEVTYRHSAPVLTLVKHATKTFVITETGSKFARSGRKWGHSDGFYYGLRARVVLNEPSVRKRHEEAAAAEKLKQDRANLYNMVQSDFRYFTRADVDALWAVVDPIHKRVQADIKRRAGL